MDHDWTQFKIRIDIEDATVKEIYDCWTSQEGLQQWFLKQADFRSQNGNYRHFREHIQKADSYKWLWHGWDEETSETGEILSVNGMDQISFTFMKCEVVVKIYEEEATTICELTQSKIATDEKTKVNTYMGCRSGWSFFMCNLKSILEGGIDLRNKNENLRNVINA